MEVLTSDKIFGGSFLLAPIGSQPQFTPEDLSDEAKAIGEAARDFMVGEVLPADEAIDKLDRTLMKRAKTDATARRLMSIPGVGPITASAMAASVQDASHFAGPREFAAFLGLTPRQNSSGGKQKLGRISKMGDRYLRKLLVVGAHAVLHHRQPHKDALRTWAKKLLETKSFKLVAVALANKMARIVFAILRSGGSYTPAAAVAA